MNASDCLYHLLETLHLYWKEMKVLEIVLDFWAIEEIQQMETF
jgi:hypothetical protein